MPIYSHSQLSAFEECPLKYKFRYIDRAQSVETSAEAFAGSMVHRTLQKLYDDLRYEKLNSVDDLIEHYQGEWRRSWNENVRIVQEGFEEDNFRDYGARCVRDYYQRNFPFNQSRTLETELKLMFQLDSQGRYRIQGFIDRVALRPDGVYEIHDYKTSNSLPDRARLESDRQLALYQIGLQARWPEVEQVELVWHYLGFDSQFVSRRTADQLHELGRQTIERINEIESCKDFRPVKSRLCDWCEYRPLCPLWKHVVAVESLPPEAVENDCGVRLATAYAEKKLQLDDLRSQLEALREALLEFSRDHRVDVIQGQEARVSISRREQFKLPPVGIPARADIETLLRSTGQWDQASEISESRLRTIIEGKRWPAAILDRLLSLLSKREVISLRVSRVNRAGGSQGEQDE